MATGSGVGRVPIATIIIFVPIRIRVIVRSILVRIVVTIVFGCTGTVISGTVVVALAVRAGTLV